MTIDYAVARRSEINIIDFGADPANVDNTNNIQNAIYSAIQTGLGVVRIPSGTFKTSRIYIPNNIKIIGAGGISYNETELLGSSILQLSDPNEACLLDCTGSTGVEIEGIVLEGNGIGSSHGIIVSNSNSFHLHDSKITGFGGDGIYGNSFGIAKIDSNYIGWNSGNGIYMDYGAADTMITRNYINANGQDGINFESGSNMNYVISNRIEWNNGHGISTYQANELSIIGNQIDRCAAEGMRIVNGTRFTIQGNIIKRCSSATTSGNEAANVFLQSCTKFSFTDNVFEFGANDNGTGNVTPAFAMTYFDCVDAMIANNIIKASTTDASYPVWSASTDYALNQNVLPDTYNSFYYTCTTAGVSAAAQPTWPTTAGQTVADGTAVWTCYAIAELNAFSNINILGTNITS